MLSVESHIEGLAIGSACSNTTRLSVAAHIVVLTKITVFGSALSIVNTGHALLLYLTVVAVALVGLRILAIVLAGVDLLLRVDFVVVASARVALESH